MVNKNKILSGGGEKSIQRQHDKGRMTARERIDYLVDKKSNVIFVDSS